MGIFDKGVYLDPKYEFLEKYVLIGWKGFWTPGKYEKLIHEVDAPYFHNQMDDISKESVKRCILAVAMVEDKVKSFFSNVHNYFPQTRVSDVGSVFSNMEAIHRSSYHSLVKEIGVDLKEMDQHEALRDRLAYLNKHSRKDNNLSTKEEILKQLLLFTSMVERISLFTSFYILMSFAKRNKGLKTISALQQSTACEELMHYSFGMDLINIVREEYPKLWSEYLESKVIRSIKQAYSAELKLIDWFFEKGVPDHLTKEEVINFLNYNFNIVTKDLKVDIEYPVDKELYERRNSWMLLKLYSSHPDFFDNAVGGYSSVEEEIDLDNFEF